jgi:large subunit ribosomal protein L4
VTRSLTVQTPVREAAGPATVELPAEIFDVPMNIPLIHQVVVAQLAAARQGSHSTKTRGDVRGGGRKPYRQKGTGRARQGSNRAPQFAGGGIVHGPQPRSYDQRTPKKMKAAALRGALSDRARNDRVFVVSALVEGEVPSTKAATEALASVTPAKHVLVVAVREDELIWKSLRNVARVHLLEPAQLNTYDVLVSDDVVFTEGALAQFLGQPIPEPKSRPAKAKDSKLAEATDVEATDAEATDAGATDAGATDAEATDAEASDTEAAEAESSADEATAAEANEESE